VRRFNLIEAAAVGSFLALCGGAVYADDNRGNGQQFAAQLSGFNELGEINNETGAILTAGTGKLELDVDKQSQTATYKLTYSGLSSSVTQAHIHFGKSHNAGGIVVYLCTNLSNGPAGTQACPTSGGTVTGTLTAASVVAIATQNVTAGDFDALTDALNSNTAYANVHTTNFPSGEIRGQVRSNEGQQH
jgi:hypothetical protein